MKFFLFLTIVLLNIGTFRLFVEAVPPLLAEEPKRYRYEPEAREDSFDEKFADIGPYYRLPESLVPTEYTIKILPIMDDTPDAGERFTAPGSVTIAVNCTRDTNVITLHAFLLDIDDKTIMIKDVETQALLPVSTWDYDDDTHFYNITTMIANPLLAGKKYEISMNYTAPVSIDRANGLYRATYYVPGDSEPRYMAGTQLEPARARQVFPCFDEPRWKSIYHVTIGRNTNYLSVANGDIINVIRHETLPDYYWDIFEATVKMPTYLFAIAVADYAYVVASRDLYRLPVGVYAARNLILQGSGDYAAEASARIMKLFEDLYKVDHPMTKVDSILIPGKGGAMENYGLVTYGNFLMYYDGETTESQRQGLVSIISHELAHQWFGNLVTCAWWSDIWLNEGFATYVSYVGMEQDYNEFEPRKWILPDAVQNAFKLDAAASSHPIVANNVNTLTEIDRHFSSLQYDKGASLIRMMEGFLTQETLDEGLRKYLARMTDQVAVQDDLFHDLNEQARAGGVLPLNKNVKDIMDTWTLQKGFPLVRVSRAGSSRVYLSQERFINSGTRMQNPLDLDPNHLWEVPISVATKADPNFGNYTPKIWIDKDIVLTSYDHDTTQWIMINNDGIAFYRVLYDVQLTNLIHEQLVTDSSVISPLSRSQLLDDYINLALQEYVSIESALKLTQYLANETDFTVWNGLFTNLRSTFNVLSGTPAIESFSGYFESRISAALKLIGVRQLPTDKGQVVILRNNLLDWACALTLETGDGSDCVLYARELLQEWLATPETNPYPIDLQSVLYCASVADGGVVAFDFVLGRYSAITSETQKSRLASALACTRDAALLDRLLDLTLTSPLTLADSITVRGRVAGNSLGRAKAFAFLQANLQEIISYHGGAGPVGTLVTILGIYYGTQQEADDLKKFIDDNSEALASVRTTLDNAVAAVGRNIVWMSKFYQPLRTWFEAQTGRV